MNHALSTEAYNIMDGGVATDGGETNPTDPDGGDAYHLMDGGAYHGNGGACYSSGSSR